MLQESNLSKFKVEVQGSQVLILLFYLILQLLLLLFLFDFCYLDMEIELEFLHEEQAYNFLKLRKPSSMDSHIIGSNKFQLQFWWCPNSRIKSEPWFQFWNPLP